MRVIDHAHLGELDQLSGLRMRHVRLEFDIGSDVLAVHEIVHADHTCKFNRRMFEQRFLDLLRGDVRAAQHEARIQPAANLAETLELVPCTSSQKKGSRSLVRPALGKARFRSGMGGDGHRALKLWRFEKLLSGCLRPTPPSAARCWAAEAKSTPADYVPTAA
jgi:hypothetical protein